MTDLAELTTLRVGGPARQYVRAATEADLIAAISEADAAGTPVLVIGGGSNLVVPDAGFDGVVVADARADVRVQDDGYCGGVSVTATAGLPWDELVARAVADEWVGLEALSGIPGSVGAAPVQNIGAYGGQISDTLASVRTWDRAERRVRTLMLLQLQFGYRDSLLKRTLGDMGPTPRYVVLDVTVQMRFGTRSAPVRYQQLADALGVELGGTASTAAVREAVLALRASKGMVLEAADHDTWSVGSFFTNPVVDPNAVPAGAPVFPLAPHAAPGAAPATAAAPATVDGAAVKTSAAWLIEHAGFGRGFALPGSRAALSSKHTLAITNRGGATAAEVLALAAHLRDGVRDAYGIELIPEPVLVGAAL